MLKIDISILDDLQALGQTNILEDQFSLMQTEIENGQIILIERSYVNSNPDTVNVIRTTQELTEFKDRYLSA